MNKKVSSILTLALAFMIVVCAFPASASSSQSKAVHVFEKVDYYKTDLTLEENREYEVPSKGILRIEEGATLWVEGELRVYGTLKNYGTIIVRQRDPKLSRKEEAVETTYGHISISGKLENYGTIEVQDGSLHNRNIGEITNSGKILLTSSNPDLVALRNIAVSNGVATQGGTILNEEKGIITVATSEGTGLISQKGATFQNNGTFQIKRGSSAKGSISGNKTEWIN